MVYFLSFYHNIKWCSSLDMTWIWLIKSLIFFVGPDKKTLLHNFQHNISHISRFKSESQKENVFVRRWECVKQLLLPCGNPSQKKCRRPSAQLQEFHLISVWRTCSAVRSCLWFSCRPLWFQLTWTDVQQKWRPRRQRQQHHFNPYVSHSEWCHCDCEWPAVHLAGTVPKWAAGRLRWWSAGPAQKEPRKDGKTFRSQMRQAPSLTLSTL